MKNINDLVGDQVDTELRNHVWTPDPQRDNIHYNVWYRLRDGVDDQFPHSQLQSLVKESLS